MNQRLDFFFVLLLALCNCFPDFVHDGVDLAGAPGVDGPALLLACHAADVGGNVVEDGRHGNVDNVGLAEGGGNGELVFLKKSNNKICFKEHYVLFNGMNVINIIS